jgi:hypothetical protein
MDITSPRHLKVANWVVLALLTVAGFLWQSREFALGVLVGGLLVVANFHLLHRTLRSTLERVTPAAPESQAWARASFAARQLFRFFGLLAIIYLLVRYSWVNIFGLLLGLSTVVLTLILAAVHEAIKLKNKEANSSHGTSHSLS